LGAFIEIDQAWIDGDARLLGVGKEQDQGTVAFAKDVDDGEMGVSATCLLCLQAVHNQIALQVNGPWDSDAVHFENRFDLVICVIDDVAEKGKPSLAPHLFPERPLPCGNKGSLEGPFDLLRRSCVLDRAC
jgi:hypothetical protein